MHSKTLKLEHTVNLLASVVLLLLCNRGWNPGGGEVWSPDGSGDQQSHWSWQDLRLVPQTPGLQPRWH